jgi:hypothetical protein
MAPDPASVFGSLLRGCISDRYLKKEESGALEGFFFVVLGLCSSLATTYVLAAVGVLL